MIITFYHDNDEDKDIPDDGVAYIQSWTMKVNSIVKSRYFVVREEIRMPLKYHFSV